MRPENALKTRKRHSAGEAEARPVRGATLGGAAVLLAFLLAVQVAQGGQAGVVHGPRGETPAEQRAEIRKVTAELVRAIREAGPKTRPSVPCWLQLGIRPDPLRPAHAAIAPTVRSGPAPAERLLVRVERLDLPPPRR